MKYITSILLLLVGVQSLHADGIFQQCPKEEIMMVDECPHHLYFGPLFFGFSLNNHVEDLCIHGQKFFGGLHLGYDYIYPRSIYAGVDGFLSIGNNNFQVSKKGKSITQKGDDARFNGYEFRAGYTMDSDRWIYSPYLGIGGYHFNTHIFHRDTFSECISYISGGLRIKYDFNQLFNFGIYAKVFKSFYTRQRYVQHKQKTYTADRADWGGEIALPFTWCIGIIRQWGLQFEPFFLFMSFCEKQNVYGFRFLFDLQF